MPPTEGGFRLRMPLMPTLLFLAAAPTATLWAQTATEPPLVVTGTLVDERGVPATDVEVTLRPYPSAYAIDLDLLGEPAALPEPADHALTRSDGTFSLSAPAIGPYRLEIRPRPAAAAPTVAIPIVSRNILPLRVPLHLEPIELPDRHHLTVRVVDPDGQPIEGAFVLAKPTARQTGDPSYREPSEQPERLNPAPSAALRVRDVDGRPAGRAVVRTPNEPSVPLALTDELGEATVGAAIDGRAAFEVETEGGAFARALARNRPSQGRAADPSIVAVQLLSPAVIPGRIADAETGAAVPDAVIWIRSDPGRRTVADRSGGFDLATPLRRSGLEFGAVAEGYRTGAAKVTASRFQRSRDMSIGLTAAAPLFGWVVDAFHHPVAGANVHVEPRGLGPFATRGLSGRATSGSDGSFWIDNALYDSSYQLTVEAPAFASERHDLPAMARNAQPGPVRIVLTRGRQPWGTVVNLEGAPLAGAQVRLLWPPDDPEAGIAYGSRDATEPVTSNDRGEFEFPLISPGQYGLSISHPEHLDLNGSTAAVPDGDGYSDLGVFTLTPGAEIHGGVVDSGRRPVQGAETQTNQQSQGRPLQNRTTTTDQGGRFRLSGLLPVLADLTATAEGYVASRVRSVRPGTGESIEIELAEGASLAGRVLDTDGTAAADVEVRLNLPVDELLRANSAVFGLGFFKRGRTDGDGRFRFDDVVPARWTAEASTEDAGASQEGIELALGELHEIELRLQPVDELTVHVTNHLGEPVAKAEISVGPKVRSQRRARGHTDSGGRVDLWISPGSANVEIEHPDLPSQSREVVLDPGDNELHVQLVPGWEISGMVRTASGSPIPGTPIEAGKARPEGLGADARSGLVLSMRRLQRVIEPPPRSISGADGSFRLTGLDRGRYRLVARLPGYTARESADEIEINGQSVTGVEVVLEPGASIRGTVTGLQSSEMATVEILAWGDVLFRSATPDTEGGFELEALAPGMWQLMASAGDRRSLVESLTLEPGATGASVELRFEPGHRLTGQVLIAGEPASDGFVTALLKGQLGRKNRLRTRTDHQGRFDIEGLPPGTYELEFGHREGILEEQSLDLQSDHYNLFVNLQRRPERPD